MRSVAWKPGLERLGDLDEDRRGGGEIEDDLRVVVPADELAVDDRSDEQQRREDDAQDERRADQPRRDPGRTTLSRTR